MTELETPNVSVSYPISQVEFPGEITVTFRQYTEEGARARLLLSLEEAESLGKRILEAVEMARKVDSLDPVALAKEHKIPGKVGT